MTAYAAAVSTTATFETLRDAASAGEAHKPSRKVTQQYRDVLARLWVLEDAPAWLPTNNRLSQLGHAAKHQLADPALAAQLLGVQAERLLAGQDAGPAIPRDGTLLGALFESLVTLWLVSTPSTARRTSSTFGRRVVARRSTSSSNEPTVPS